MSRQCRRAWDDTPNRACEELRHARGGGEQSRRLRSPVRVNPVYACFSLGVVIYGLFRELQDSITQAWNTSLVARIVGEYVEEHGIASVRIFIL